MEDVLFVTCFWLSVLSLWLAWRVFVLKRTVRQMLDWQRLAMQAFENVLRHPRHAEDDDSILESEVIE